MLSVVTVLLWSLGNGLLIPFEYCMAESLQLGYDISRELINNYFVIFLVYIYHETEYVRVIVSSSLGETPEVATLALHDVHSLDLRLAHTINRCDHTRLIHTSKLLFLACDIMDSTVPLLDLAWWKQTPLLEIILIVAPIPLGIFVRYLGAVGFATTGMSHRKAVFAHYSNNPDLPYWDIRPWAPITALLGIVLGLVMYVVDSVKSNRYQV